MAWAKVFNCRYSLSSPNFKPVYWSVPCRGKSKQNTVLKEMGLPEKPKRPANPFILYFSSIHKQLAIEAGTNEQNKLAKIAWEKWQKAPDHEKNKFIKEFEKKKEVYKAEMQKFSELMTADVRMQLSELVAKERMKEAQRDIERKIKEQEKEFKKPQHPGSVFSFFQKKVGKNELMADNLRKWKEMPKDLKEAYAVEFAEVFKKYKENLLKWEEEMLQKGNIDLVKLSTIRQKLYNHI